MKDLVSPRWQALEASTVVLQAGQGTEEILWLGLPQVNSSGNTTNT